MRCSTWAGERGYGQVDEVVTAEEDLLFALPQELRRELKAAGMSAATESVETESPESVPS